MKQAARRLFVAACLWGVSALAQAQGWPAAPLRMVVPFTAGSATDIMARTVAEKLGRPGERPCDVIRDFVKSLGLPSTLGDIGIGADRIPDLARQYDGTGPIATNPRPVRGADDLAEIMKLAL